MKHIRAAAKVSRASKLKALTGGADSASGAPSSAPQALQQSVMPPMAATSGQAAGAGGSAPTMPMQVKRGGSVKKRAAGGGVKMTAGAGSGDGRLQKTKAAKGSK